MNIFDKSGLAAASDLNSSICRELFSKLEKEQDTFIEKESAFRSGSYKWPHDSLHNWSRIWEYPYIYYHLANYINTFPKNSRPIVVDVGSGVTFFPFSLAKLGYRVLCADIDGICERDLSLARECISHSPGTVDFRLIEGHTIPVGDSECDVVYCISVLEHIPNFEKTIDEVSRILKPDGLFILTIDLDLCGYMDIGAKRYDDLRQCLFEHFELKETEVTVHPCDILQPRTGPFPYLRYSTWQKWKFYVKQRIKPLFGKKPFHALPNLTVWGAIMTKTIKKQKFNTID